MPRFLFLAMSMAAICTPNSVAAEGDADNGKVLARTNCARCHGIDGNARSTSFQPVPMLAGQPEVYLLKEMRNFASGTRLDGSKGEAMSGFLTSLTDQELEDIAAYYAGQPRY